MVDLQDHAGSGVKAGALDDAVLDTDFSGLPARQEYSRSKHYASSMLWSVFQARSPPCLRLADSLCDEPFSENSRTTHDKLIVGEVLQLQENSS